jgi:hypothetical protein
MTVMSYNPRKRSMVFKTLFFITLAYLGLINYKLIELIWAYKKYQADSSKFDHYQTLKTYYFRAYPNSLWKFYFP